MAHFEHLEGDTAIISSGGVEQQVDLYQRNGFLYAEISKNKFVKLSHDRTTSKAGIMIMELNYDGAIYMTPTGKLVTELGDRNKQIAADKKKMLLCGPPS